jgi:two-component system OmpR family sensor kinase
VQVAQRLSVRLELAQNAALQAGLPILIAVPLSWLILLWVIGRSLKRLERLAGEIAERGVGSRGPLSIAGVPIEVLPLVKAMNILIGRLQQALGQQKRFVSDAAHELRTPLAALQIQLDNLATGDGVPRAPAIAAMRAGVARAAALVARLLQLARSEEPNPKAPWETMDLPDLLTACLADFVPLATTKGIDLGFLARDPVTMSGSRADLKILFDNLIENALHFTPPGGSVDLAARATPESFEIEILDTGPGVAEADIPRLFDRFFRAAPTDVEGSGLGLSIAAVIAGTHGLAISIANRSDRQGLRVSVAPSAASGDLIRP